jgi:CHAT domain-containing protein
MCGRAVHTDSTVRLITKALSAMAADTKVGRSEALCRSMLALLEKGEPHEAHPSYWAPFAVVGEGIASIESLSQQDCSHVHPQS